MKIIPIILTIIFGRLTIYFAKLNYDLKLNQSDVVIERDSLKVENTRILKLVDFLTIKNESNIDKLNLIKTEQKESTKTD